MKDDKLIELGFDGLTPEVVAMSDEQRAEIAANQSLKEALLSLNETIPEPQISFERVRTAIEQEPAATRGGLRLWPALSGLATACVAVAGIFYLMQNNSTGQQIAVDTDTNGSTELAMNLPTEATPSSDVDLSAPFVLPEEPAPTQAVAEPAGEVPQAAPRTAPRRTRPAAPQPADSVIDEGMLIASNVSPAAYSVVSNVADMASNQRSSENAAARGAASNSGASADPIVIVQTGLDPMTGSTPATEERSPQSVVLGG